MNAGVIYYRLLRAVILFQQLSGAMSDVNLLFPFRACQLTALYNVHNHQSRTVCKMTLEAK